MTVTPCTCTYDQPHTHTEWVEGKWATVNPGDAVKLVNGDGSVSFRVMAKAERGGLRQLHSETSAYSELEWRLFVEAPPTPQPVELPTEPGTLWLDSDGDLWRVNSSGEFVCLTANDGIYKPPAALYAEAFTPFTKLEPRNETAKAVTSRLRELLWHSSTTVEDDLANVAAEFGVTDA